MPMSRCNICDELFSVGKVSKVKQASICIARRRKSPVMRPGMARVRRITVLLATHTFIQEWNEPSCLYSVSIHQMALPERGSAHPITAHYSFTDLERIKGRVGLVG